MKRGIAPYLVKSASTARSMAFLKRAVAINSIVRVILRMLRTALRRLTRTRVLAMNEPYGTSFSPA